MTQEEVAERAGLNRVDVNRLESGALLGTSAKQRDGIAAAFRLTARETKELLSGALGPIEAGVLYNSRQDAGSAGSPNLENCLRYHGKKWTDVTLAAARAVVPSPEADPEPSEWLEILNELEERLRDTRLLRIAPAIWSADGPRSVGTGALKSFDRALGKVARGTNERDGSGKNRNKP